MLRIQRAGEIGGVATSDGELDACDFYQKIDESETSTLRPNKEWAIAKNSTVGTVIKWTPVVPANCQTNQQSEVNWTGLYIPTHKQVARQEMIVD